MPSDTKDASSHRPAHYILDAVWGDIGSATPRFDVVEEHDYC